MKLSLVGAWRNQIAAMQKVPFRYAMPEYVLRPHDLSAHYTPAGHCGWYA
jgi:hypothetical protein